jgi:5-methylcytosine-specific restriction endonuclease McrA
MKFEILVFGITAFFVANTYYDGKYMDILKSWKKYYKMAGIAFAGLSAYLFIRKYPSQSGGLLTSASALVKHLPIDKEACDMFSPLLDLTSASTNTNSAAVQERRILNSGKTGTKRCVSETKKKFVASQQGWNCGDCGCQLPAWFEVDHRVRLDSGGSNHVDNLVALCRDCHGKKTAFENL